MLGAMAGIAMHRYRLPWLPLLVLTPVAMPEILLGVSLLLFFRQVLDLTLGFFSILVAHITFSIGFVAVIVRARLARHGRRHVRGGTRPGRNAMDDLPARDLPAHPARAGGRDS